MGTSAKQFEQNILDSGYILDAVGTHHEFVSGMHGRKLDFDLIPEDSELFEQWVELAARKIKTLYAGHNIGKLILVSVANGTNRVVGPVADTIGDITPILTEKDPDKDKHVRLAAEARETIKVVDPDLAIVLEDVGTSGFTTSTAVEQVRSVGVPKTEVITTWQRRPQLEKLDEIRVRYAAIINTLLPTYSPEECSANSDGYCAQGWDLIPRK